MIAKMMILRVVLCCLVVLIILVMPVSVFAMAIYVPDGYSTIQAAVDNAAAGDTIIVRSGIYNENIDVNKPHLTIKSKNGAGSTIVRASEDHIFKVTADHVNIIGFTIEDASFNCGILLSGVNNCNISNNIVSGNYQGIHLSKSSRNTIFSNTAFSNEICGIVLDDTSTHNQVIKNDASNNLNYHGILLLSSSENTIAYNMAKNNGENGIYLEESNDNKITSNDASNNANYNGISLNSSTDNEISNNIANSNHYEGIGLWTSSDKNTIANNTAKNNGENGIYLEESNDNKITSNDASNNANYNGISLNSSTDNEISNNIANSNHYEGIGLWTSSDKNTIANNTAKNNGDNGIYIEESNNNIVTENKANNNGRNGISMFSLSGNTITGNTASNNNQSGIWIEESTSNTIRENIASNNNYSGICVEESNSNKIYLNNFINNTDNVYSESPTNIWNSPSKIFYIYKASTYTSYLGNYWDDYTGSDADGDGIGDTPYNINTVSDKYHTVSDKYPLIDKFENYRVVSQSGIETKPVFGVELSVDTDVRSTAPSENALYKLTVNNTGAVVDTYTLSVKNPDNADVAALSTRDITNLAAGASTTVRLSVTDAMAGSYTVSVTATSEGDPTKSDTISTTTTVEDTTPPASIINLKNTTYAQAYINWTWNDPADDDLSHVMVYLNGGFQINVSKGTQYYNATELTLDIAYTIGTCTVDRSGNKNQTMVNHTARTASDTKPPVIIHTPIITAIERSPIRISATITDDIEVASATLFFRIIGKETWTPTSMSPIGNNYSATIEASNVTTAGVEYYIEAVDAASNPAHSPATAPKAPYSITIKSAFGVELSVDTAARSTAPGENALYKLTVNNTGAVVDTYTLSVKNPDSVDVAALSIYPHITNLAAGASTTVRLYVKDAIEGSYTVSVTATSVGDPTKSDTVSTTTTVKDTTLPASIINLKNTTYAQTYINWTWNDPADADLSHVMVYLNGYFQINVSKGTQFFNATKLTPDSAYTIGARTVDRSGNNNQTMVNHTARTALDKKPPVIIHTPIITAIEGSPIPISATITDDIKVASATLFFRITGEETWTSSSMSPIGNNYSATLQASNVTTAGVEYYIEAVDAALNDAYSPATLITVSGRSIVTISATPSTINLSDRVTISGKISPAHDTIVTLTFTTPSGNVQEHTTTSALSGAYKYNFRPNEGGIWLLNATWTGSSDIAGNVSETVSFTVNIRSVCYAIIIVGGKNDSSQRYFDLTANTIYKKLLSCAFTHKHIFYLNPSMEQDADGDGNSDVDRISSLTNISYAFGTWAQGNVRAEDTLLLYMVNHGKANTFIVNGVDNILTATDLNNHLNNFTDATGCKNITVVYGACNSGSFIDELSGVGRVIVTSTNSDTISPLDRVGEVFTYYFFNSISVGETIKDAFEEASNSKEMLFYNAHLNVTPLLDDNADRVGHAMPLSGTDDGSLAASKHIGVPYCALMDPPRITDVIPSQKVVVNTTITIWAVVVNDSSINDVYASIFEPNFNISSTKDTLINLTTLYLEDPDGDGNYTASFTPTELGNYTLILHATDDEDYIASPKQCIITAVLPSGNAIFNTCVGTYPSTFGKHNGLWNSTWKGVEARKGSYPQIIHESGNDILGGEIACREFMAANRYLYIKVMGFPL